MKSNEEILDRILNTNNRHVFLTGKAGTGKSTLLEKYIEETNKSIAVLAPTGVAAINIGGETIHSFFGFKTDVTEKDAIKLGHQKRNNKLFRALEVVIIDEVSMLRADLLDFINLFLQQARESKLPFGGVMIIFVGDLFQLPPVVGRDEQEYFRIKYRSPYFFSSNVFKELITDESIDFIVLNKIYRQKDSEFKKILNSIRENKIDFEVLKKLNQRANIQKIDKDTIFLVSTNYLADSQNKTSLEKLKGKEKSFTAKVEGNLTEKEYPTSFDLVLKKNARVMFLNNDLEKRWHNGSIGTVTDFDEENEVIWVKLDTGDEVSVSKISWTKNRTIYDASKDKVTKEVAGSFTQYPLKLAWAITIHKSQGKTFDKVHIDLGSGAFAHGQTYVALSRCRTLKGISLSKELTKRDIILDKSVLLFTNYIENK